MPSLDYLFVPLRDISDRALERFRQRTEDEYFAGAAGQQTKANMAAARQLARDQGLIQ